MSKAVLTDKPYVLYCVCDDWWFFRESIRSFKPAGHIVVFVSRTAWDGSSGDWERCARIAEEEGCEVIVGDFGDESAHRRHAQNELRKRGCRYVFIPDSDEIIDRLLLEIILEIARLGMAEQIAVFMDTYWYGPNYRIRPRERITPTILIDLTQVQHHYIREYHGGRHLVLEPGYGVLHHLSYAGPDERIKRKIFAGSHRSEILQNWYPTTFLTWADDRMARNIHPTHPQAYGFAERIPVPDILKGAWNERPVPEDPVVPANWKRPSIIIPLYGGKEIIACLRSLVKCADLLLEVIVVDDCSPDDAAEQVERFIAELPGGTRKKFKLIRNAQNLGFGGTSNVGYAASKGEVVVFLNSDTIVPRAGLIRLIECLMSSAANGIVGPYTNESGYHQRIDPTYTEIANLDLFARDFAARDVEDEEVPMLVGFCMAAKRAVLEEIIEDGSLWIGPEDVTQRHDGAPGPTESEGTSLGNEAGADASARSPCKSPSQALLPGEKSVRDEPDEGSRGADPHESSPAQASNEGQRQDPSPPSPHPQPRGPFDTRFGRGMFEDNDTCFRVLRRGYKLKIATLAYVHHEGSKSLPRMDVDAQQLLAENMERYHAKWREEIESGYASHLPGQSPKPIVFDPKRHPDTILKEIAKLQRKTGICCCMIIRNEAPRIRECLNSLVGVFTRVVVVDTGSTDGTKEIVQEFVDGGARNSKPDAENAATGKGAKHSKLGALRNPTPKAQHPRPISAQHPRPNTQGLPRLNSPREGEFELHEYEWCDSFSAARNESMKYAKEDFIFWLDADDVLPPVAALKILNAAYTAPFDVNAFIMVVRFPDGTQVDHLKLFRNLKGLEWLGRHHEQILPGISKFPGRIERIRDAFVYHKNQDRTPEGLAIKAAREDIDLRKDLEDQPDHPFFNFNWGMTLVMRGEDEESLEFLRKSIDLGHGESHVRKSYALLGLALSHLGDVDGALEAYDTGLEEVGEDDAEINYQLAILLASLDGFAEAKEHLLAIPGDISGHFSSLDVKILGPLKFHWLGLVCLGLEQYAEAREWFRKAAAAGWGQSAIELFKAALEREDFKAARESCDLLQSVEGFSENWAKMGADLAGARGESAEGFLLDASRRVPTAPGPRLVHARLLLAAGREAEAESQLEFLENIRCAEGAFLLGMLAFRRGDIEGALAHTEKAAQLDPNHAAAKEQLENLRGAQGSEHHG